MEKTYWNGRETEAVRGTAIVADDEFPQYWARREGIIGKRIPVVRVVMDSVTWSGGVDYLDNRDGSGWRKVTDRRDGSRYPHTNVVIEPGSFREL